MIDCYIYNNDTHNLHHVTGSTNVTGSTTLGEIKDFFVKINGCDKKTLLAWTYTNTPMVNDNWTFEDYNMAYEDEVYIIVMGTKWSNEAAARLQYYV